MKLPGDMIEDALKPLVAGTKYEGCKACKARKDGINKFFTNTVQWVKRVFNIK